MLHNRYLERGGEDTSFQMEVDLLRHHGCTVEVYEENNKRIEKLGVLRTALRSSWSVESYRNIRKMLREQKFDVLHVQNFFPLISPSAYYAAHHENVPVVQTLRNYRLLCPPGTFYRNDAICEDCLHKAVPWPGVMHKCYRGSFAGSAAIGAMVSLNRLMGTWRNKVDLYVALTDFSRDKFIEGGLPADKIVVKNNFIAPVPEVGPGGGGYVVFVGRLTREKGILTVLAAWERLDGKVPLKIVGTGPLEAEVKAAADRIPGIDYLGWQDPESVLDLMGKAEITLFPSQWYETFGRVVIESLAKGTPVVGSRLGAIAELIDDGRNGFLFRPGDPVDLSEKIVDAWAKRDKTNSIRSMLREEVVAKYSGEKNYPRLIEVYERAIRERRAA